MLILEHGIAVEQKPNGLEGLRVIARTDLAVYSSHSVALLDVEGNHLNERIALMLSPITTYHSADFYEERDVRYSLRTCSYHLDRLVGRYWRITELFEKRHPLPKIRGNTPDPAVYFEVDAFLTAARRVYEMLRKLLWKHYGNGQSRPRSFQKLLESNLRLPAEYGALALGSWQRHGERLTAYRDCMTHYDPLDTGAETCFVEVFGGYWGVNVRLPSNPETKSRASFVFDGPEVLEYCSSVLSTLTDLAEATQLLQPIAERLANPMVH